MRNFLKMTALAAVSSAFLVGASFAETTNVTFVLINDIDTIDEDDAGGFGRVAAVAKAEKAAADNVVLVHAGDSISPSVLSGIDEGAHIVDLLNRLDIDVFVPGNHEFDFGPDIFRTRIGEMDFDVISANIRQADGSSIDGIEDTKTMVFGDVTIGFVGLTSADAKEKSSPGDIQFNDMVETLESNATALREGGADLIVAVTHATRSQNYELAASRAADLILSGDNHDLLLNYDGRTVLAEGREQGVYVPVISLAIEVGEDDGEREIDWRPDFKIVSTFGMEPDPDVQGVIANYESELAKELDVVIGKTATELDTRRATVRTQEATFGNLVADAMKHATGADVALTNGGGIRADKTYPAGTEITRRDILTELPFGNSTVVVELTGAQILAALENGVSAVEDVSGRFPHIAGMNVEADLTKPAGSRVQSVMVGDTPLDADKAYTLATNDYLLKGGDGYTMFPDGRVIVDPVAGKLMANDVMVFVRENGEVSPAVEGRMNLVR